MHDTTRETDDEAGNVDEAGKIQTSRSDEETDTADSYNIVIAENGCRSDSSPMSYDEAMAYAEANRMGHPFVDEGEDNAISTPPSVNTCF